MDQYILDSGKIKKDMVLDTKFGQMELNIKVNGFTIKLMVMGNFTI